MIAFSHRFKSLALALNFFALVFLPTLRSDAIRKISALNAFRLAHRGCSTALSTASCYSLPPNTCSSVTGCWLDFCCTELTSLIVLALLGTLIDFPINTYTCLLCPCANDNLIIYHSEHKQMFPKKMLAS